MGPTEAEVHGRLFDGLDEFGQIVARAQPGKDTIALPSPGDHFFPGQIGVEVPAILTGKFFDALMQMVVIPAEGQQDALLSLHHD